jgi:hypothetical protein
MRAFVALLAGLIVLAAAAVAEAQRKPTPKERTAIAGKFDIPAKCLRIRVSTVNERWARLNYKGRKYDDPDCREHAADGIVVLKRKRGRWRIVTQGSDFECPVPGTPPRVAEDLKIPCYEP